MLYALTRADGGVSVAWVMPKEAAAGGKTFPVTFINNDAKLLTVQDGDKELMLPLSSSDIRELEVDSIPGYTLAFFDIAATMTGTGVDYVSYAKITVADLPPSRSYRDAWAVSGTTLTYNMTKAKDIHRDKLRLARQPMLDVLDVAYQRADEQDDGPLKRRIAAEKQKLRDITIDPRIEQAADVAALELLTVDVLLH